MGTSLGLIYDIQMKLKEIAFNEVVVNPKVSVIVPVYKAELYLPRCVGSILSQTFSDFELLLIDDGSPDCSGRICDEYAEKDSRIRVFHKENGGVASARQMGLDNAKGEYTIHVDPDDWVEPNMLEILNNKEIEITNINIFICETQCFLIFFQSVEPLLILIAMFLVILLYFIQ